LNLVGLGKVGCNLVLELAAHGPYKIFLLDKRKHRRRSLRLDDYKNPEDYEKNCPDFSDFFAKIRGPVCVVLSGANFTTSLSLRLIEYLKKKDTEELYILYVKPDTNNLPELQKIHERMVMGVLQQYARSGLVDRMYLVSNNEVEKVSGSTSVVDYHKSLNSIIAYTYHMINVFNNTKSIISTLGTPPDTSRISSFGILDLKNKEKNMFFSLDFPRRVGYYYGVSSEKLNSDTEFHSEVKDFIKSSTPSGVNAGYAIYEMGLTDDFCLVVEDSTLIQEQNL
jgi:hypothetical protein